LPRPWDLELIPPYVQMELLGQAQAQDMNATPVRQFAAEVMQVLKTNPDATEIRVERVRPLQNAGALRRCPHGDMLKNSQIACDILAGQDIG